MHKSAIKERDINKLTISAVLFCLFVLLSRCRGFEESPRVYQVVWGFKTTACGPLHLWGIGCHGKGRYGSCRTQDCEETKVLEKRVETGRRRQGKRACFTGDLLLPHM